MRVLKNIYFNAKVPKYGDPLTRNPLPKLQINTCIHT